MIETDIDKYKDSTKKRLLLHTCCAPCAAGTVDDLIEFYDLTFFYLNPNILPEKEYLLRYENLLKLANAYKNIEVIVPTYDPEKFISLAKDRMHLPEGGSRCTDCFTLRLSETAKFMRQSDKYFGFATTLTLSPHKNAELINSIGKSIENSLGVRYLTSNFKKNNGVLKSINKCKELNIYRQSYCGCSPPIEKL